MNRCNEIRQPCGHVPSSKVMLMASSCAPAPTVSSLSLGSNGSNGLDVPPHRQRAWPVHAFGLATVTQD